MSTLENLFMQIFDRRTWIVEHQLKPQRQSYDQSLASNLLINGIRPPPWLWNSTTSESDAEKSDPKELKKEELISSLLFPPPRPPCPALSTGNYAFYSKRTIKGDIRQVSDSSVAETCNSNKCFDSADRSMAVRNSSLSGNEAGDKYILNEVPGVDTVSTSQVQTGPKISELLSEPDPQLLIPNNSLTHNVLGQNILNEGPMLNPTSASPRVWMDAKIAETYSEPDQLPSKGPLKDNKLGQKYTLLNPISASPQVQMNAKGAESFVLPDCSLLRFQRSRSRQKALEFRNSAKAKTKRRSLKENIVSEYTGRVTRSRSSCQQPTSDMEPLKPKSSFYITGECDVKVTPHRSNRQLLCANELLQLEESLNQVRGGELQKEAGAKTSDQLEHANNNVIQSSNGANDVIRQAYSVGTTETEFVSGLPDRAHSFCSERKMVSANDEIGLEFILSRPHTDTGTFIEPKQLIFDDIEDPAANPPLQEYKLETSLDMGAVQNLMTCQSSQEITVTMDLQEMNAEDLVESVELLQADELTEEKEVPQVDELVQEKEFLQKIERLNREKEAGTTLVEGQGEKKSGLLETEEAECNVSHSSFICKPPDLSALSLKNKTSISVKEFCGDALGDPSSVCNGILNDQVQAVIDDMSPSQEGGGKISFRSQPLRAVVSKLPEVASKFLPAQSSKDVSVTMDFQEMNEVSSDEVVHDKKLCKADELVQEKEKTQTDELMQGKEVWQKIEVLNRKEACKTIIEGQGEERLEFLETAEPKHGVSYASFTCNPSDLSTLSMKNRMLLSVEEVCGGALGETSPASNGKSNPQAQIGANSMSPFHGDGGKSSSRSELLSAMDFNLPEVTSHPQTTCITGPKCIGDLDVEPTKNLLEDCEVETAAKNAPIISASTDFSVGTGFPCSRKTDMFSEAQDSRLSSVAMDSAKGRSALRQSITSKGAQIQKQQAPYFLRRSTNYSKTLHSSKSNESYAIRRSGRLARPTHTCETSWPIDKRRKKECQSNVFTTSPRVRRPPTLLQGHEDSISKQSESSEDASEVILEFEHFPVSHREEVEQSNVAIESHESEDRPSKKCRMTMESRMSPKLQLSCSTLPANEGDVQMKGKDQSGMFPVGSKVTYLEASLDVSVRRPADGNSPCFLKEVGETTEPATIFTIKGRGILNEEIKPTLGEHGLFSARSGISSYYGDLHFLGADIEMPELEWFNGGVPRQEGRRMSDSTKGTMEEIKVSLGDHGLLSSYSARSSCYDDLDLFGKDETMPELRGLNTSVPPKKGVNSPVHLRGANILSSLPDHSINFTMPDVCQSVPNGLLENFDLRKAHVFSCGDVNLSMGSEYNKLAGSYCSIGSERYNSSTGRCHSDCMPSSSAQYGWDATRPPYSPPLGKLCHSNSSEKHVNRNPELTCFRIDEDTCINQENGHPDDTVEPFQTGSSRKKNISNERELLGVVSSKYENSPRLVSIAGQYLDRVSVDPMNMEIDLLGTQTGCRKMVENSYRNNRKYKNEDKENQSPLLVGNGVGKAAEHHNNRFSRPKLSRKANEKKGSQTFSDKRCKPTNIVSNISSFIPFVQNKQQTAAGFTAKRDVKVKALEAAEAVKRLEEKRENERKLRKEAAKLERAKQENVRQLELKKKQEERKKKEIEMAERKRLREEEEEKKEKEKKRKCIEEARKQQKERKEKLQAEKEEKELRRKAADAEQKRKQLADETRKQQIKEKGREGAGCMKKMDTEARHANVLMANAIHGSHNQEDHKVSHEHDHIGKAVKNSDNSHKANEDRISVIEANEVPESYVISPYQGSDNEEDDDDDGMAEKKFIPSWARGKCVAQSLSSLKHIDPSEIFCRERCFRLSEVLLPRK